MATAEQYADWIVKNKDKQGTPEFNTVAEAYKIARNEPIAPQEMPKVTDSMSFTDKALAGIGKSFADTGRGLKQLGAQAGNKLGVVSDETVRGIQSDVDAYANLDKDLMNTGAGVAGNIVGQAVQFAAPGALVGKAPLIAKVGAVPLGKFALAGAGGAAAGATQPVATGNTRTGQAVAGAIGGVAGQGIASTIGKIASSQGSKAVEKAAKLQSESAQKFAAAKKASELGYVIPPADLKPGVISELASGISGKIKTAQKASQKNQNVTNSLVKKSLGLSPEDKLDIDTLNDIRKVAGTAYEKVANMGVIAPSKTYEKSLDDAIKPFVSASKSFPNRAVPSIVKDIESLKTKQFDAGDAIETIKLLRNDADVAYRNGNNLEGKAYKKAALALEDAIDEHLVNTGAPKDLLDGYRGARKIIAKTYTVQGALNPETGAVNAVKLAGDLKKGKPLEGELLNVAKTAQAFEKSMQMLKEAPKDISPLDYATAVIAAGGTGNVAPLALVGARPALRTALLSKTAQKSAINGAKYAPSTAAKVLPKVVNSKFVQGASVPIGVALGLQQN
jgi:hypothetical protein